MDNQDILNQNQQKSTHIYSLLLTIAFLAFVFQVYFMTIVENDLLRLMTVAGSIISLISMVGFLKIEKGYGLGFWLGLGLLLALIFTDFIAVFVQGY